MVNEDVRNLLTWLEKRNIELRTKVHTSDAIQWLPLFKSIDELLSEYKKI